MNREKRNDETFNKEKNVEIMKRYRMITPLRFRHPLDIINPSMYKMLAILFDSLPEICTLNSLHIFLLPIQKSTISVPAAQPL